MIPEAQLRAMLTQSLNTALYARSIYAILSAGP